MRLALRFAITTLIGLCATGNAYAQTPAPGDATPPALRIPAGARPTHYTLALTVVPSEAKAQGEIEIDVELDRPHAVLWLNGDSVNILRASTSAADTRVDVIPGNDQFIGLAFEPPLPAGAHRITLAFEAEQSRNSNRGIFALEDRGAWYVMTQFEATSARRAFPCFDEPGFKVPWQLTLRVPRDLVAVSNTPIESTANTNDGMKTVRFAQTRPLPSYLLAFAVGPWKSLDLGRVGAQSTPMRIVVPRGREADGAFVARAYPQLFGLEERWFGIAYPYTKLDHIAIPLTVGFAMENVALITYGSTILLAKPDAATPRFRHDAANVGAHEMAHQWFGDLVTTAWWDDLWLNESFATWFAEKMVDAWQPGYEHGAARVAERAQAIDEDALTSARQIRQPILNRGDIFNAFDAITYQKGATVLGMFEGWLGEAAFRRGVRQYLESRADGNATADDFLAALSAASGRPVAPAFATFLNQNGVPQVRVELQCAGRDANLVLTQHRYTPLGARAPADQRWQIPVCARYGTGTESQQTCTLLSEPTQVVHLDGACPGFVFANAGGRGYYLPEYGGALLTKLAANRKALSAAEYASLLYDLCSLLRAGSIDAAQALAWARVAADAKDRHVVLAAIELARFVRDTLIDDAQRARYAAFVRAVFGPRARALGLAPRPGESDDDQLMRRSVIRFAAAEDPKLAAQTRRLAFDWIRDRKAIDPGMVDSVLIVAAQRGDAALFDALLAQARATQDRLDRRNIMVALLSFGDPLLAQRGLTILLDQNFDIRELTNALRATRDVIPPRRQVHAFIAANFDALAGRVEREAPGGWPVYAAGLCSEEDRAEVAAFWRERAPKYPGTERNLARALESIELCTRLRAAEQPSLASFLRAY